MDNRKILKIKHSKQYILYVWGSINQYYLIMDSVFKFMNGFVKSMTGFIMGLLGLAIVATFLFGTANGFFGLDVVGNIGAVLDTLTNQATNGGMLGLIGLLIVWGLISR